MVLTSVIVLKILLQTIYQKIRTGGVVTSSPRTRSRDRPCLYVVPGSPSKKIGPRIQGRILFKQAKPIRSVAAAVEPRKMRLNYRSNIAGIVKIVSTSGLTEAHRVLLRRTPFWLMFEAILENDLKAHDFRKCDEPGVFPRFLKWNVGSLLARLRSVTLDDVDKFEVLPGRLQVSKYERDQLLSGNNVVDGSDDDFEERVDMIDDVHRDDNTIDAKKSIMNVSVGGDQTGMQVKAKLAEEMTMGRMKRVAETGEGGVSFMTNTDAASIPATLEDAHRTIFVLQSENKSKDFVIAKLEDQVSKLMSSLEQQASNMFVGFNSCLKVKDDEIARMAGVISDLRSTITGLEDKLAFSDANPTGEGARRRDTEDDTDSFAFVDEKKAEELIHDVTQTAVGRDSVGTGSGMDIALASEKVLHAEMFAPDGGNQKDLKMVRGKAGEVPVGSALQNSFVKKIKEKVRRERKLPEFEYPMLRGRLRRVDGSEGQRAVSEGGINFNIDLCEEVEVVNKVDEHDKKRSGYGLNNRFAVWKLVKDDVKRKISTAYERDGDDAVIWTGGKKDVFVYFSDIKNLVRHSVTRGNVVDACAELLVSKQNVLAAGMVSPEKSYFFSGICLDMVVNMSDTSRDRYLEANFRALMRPVIVGNSIANRKANCEMRSCD
ncbi:hypothetical protein LOK49_LG10G00838 [Camellia lanceoleosa]|uniref:Uncharacterized protein n=1 Tax=Camellia lanceoleosa TaxID=1840588 RepID=A0ACC0GAT2_9ERIC|nr:hypothetical protein LOK49_LG10G00838 [Camellia lanceoleosa]